jgi:two-component system sensor histidine kinase UhpB
MIVGSAASGIIFVFVFWSMSLKKQVITRTANLAESEERFRGTFEQAAVGIAHVGVDGRFLRLNRKFCEIAGYTEEDLLARTFQDITHPDDLDDDLDQLTELLAGRIETYTLEKRYIRKDGDPVWINLTVSLFRGEEGEARKLVAVIEDISARKSTEQRMKALASQMSLAEERERRRIARELHDQVGQTLALSRLRIAAVRKGVEDGPLAGLLDGVSENLLGAIQDTRNLVFDLSIPSLNEIGLGAAITEWVEVRLASGHGLVTEVVDRSNGRPADPDLRALLFRCVRELLTNVVRHAGATRVTVLLEVATDLLTITVEDDGVGCDTDGITRGASPQGGFGLLNIKERMADFGGSLQIESEPHKGCRVVLTAPLHSEEAV